MSGVYIFLFKQKTAYYILTCDWSSDVCSSDLIDFALGMNNLKFAGGISGAGVGESGDHEAPYEIGKSVV